MATVDRPPNEDPFLEWKVGLFSVAAVVGLGGIFLEEGWMIGGAIALLAGALSLRFLPGGGGGSLYSDDEEEDDDVEQVSAADADPPPVTD